LVEVKAKRAYRRREIKEEDKRKPKSKPLTSVDDGAFKCLFCLASYENS